MLIRLILCIDDKGILKHLKQSLTETDLFLECYSHPHTVWQKAIRSCGDVIVISKSLIPQPVDINIDMLNDLPERPTTVILHSDEDPEAQAQLVAAGADVVLDMGISPRSMVEAIQTVLESRRQYVESRLQGSRSDFRPSIADFGSKSEAMRIFLQEVRRVTSSGAPLLVMGETGVGKEHLARAIHLESPRSGAEFVAVNTAALPDQLLESELFGHTEGAFTGATRARRGAFELAHHGTLFLDEIGEMPIHLQTKLLRVLQDYEVKQLGSEQPIWVDVRVIAATSNDLEEQVRLKAFRQDLFYRLNVVPLTIPPLRDRTEDIPILAEKFLERWRFRSGQEIKSLSPDVLDALCHYDWPGNVRELFNVLERALLLGEDNRIELANLPQVLSNHGNRSMTSNANQQDPDHWINKSLAQVLEENVETTERRYLEATLRRTQGRIGQAAEAAGISPRSLYMKMKKYGIDKKAFKERL
ncbi:MAG: sigma-54-dependent Fis family transcriptional regulator [Pirellulales bacterium]|nr:sigma-54-dependent Fis family transcriptional regulator [Pirellulales bacterium]